MIPGSVHPLLAGATTYLVQNSLRFSSASSTYLTRTALTPTNNLKWTWSAWIKLGDTTQQLNFLAGSAATTMYMGIETLSTNSFVMQIGGTRPFVSSGIFRDPTAWYHFVFVYDSANATQADRGILYVNGVRASTSTNAITLNQATSWNTTGTNTQLIGYSNAWSATSADYFDGYMAEVYFVDGQALTASSFGQTDNVTNVWVPKKYTGTYGINGFYLEFKDASAATNTAIGKDSSGNGNHWTPSAISVTSGNTFDQMVDTPTLNYPTLSMIDKSAAVVVNRSTLKITGGSQGGLNTFSQTGITFNLPTYGKWYFEFKRDSAGADSQSFGPNITRNYRGGNGWPATRNNDGYPGYYSFEYGFAVNHATGAVEWRNNFIVTAAAVATNTGLSTATTAVYGFAVDCDNSLAYLYENGTLKTNSNGLSFVHPGANAVVSIFKSDHIVSVNFGQQPFANTPPTGYKALNSNNLLTPTIQKSSLYFDTITYTGNGSTSNVGITGTSFTPDTIWFKRRDSATNGDHVIVDSSRFSGLTTANTFISNTALNWFGSLSSWQFGLDATGTGVRGGGSLGVNVRTGTFYDVDIDANTPFEIEYQLRGIDTANAQGTVAIYRKQDQANIGTTLTNYFALGMFSATSTHWVGGLDPASTIGLAYIHSSASVDAAEEKSANIVSLTSNVATTNVFVLAREADGNLKAYRTDAAGSRVLIKTHSEKTNSIMRIAINSSAEGNFLGLQYLKVNLLGGVTSTAKRYASLYPSSTTLGDTIEEELVSFNSNGFTIKNSGDLSVGSGNKITSRLNMNTATMVSWAWKEDPSSGFDVVTYSGTGANTNVSHSLGVAPSMIIVKQRAANTAVKLTNWAVWHKDIANTSYILLTGSAAGSAVGATYWNNITPNSTTFSVGTAVDTNDNKGLYIAYLWSEVAGFSRFGSYTGNGSTDGPFVWCGFRPRFVMIKRSDSTDSGWMLRDAVRDTFNNLSKTLSPFATSAESAYAANEIDFLSNGFKLRHGTATGYSNASGGTYIFAAFAETPFKYARAR